MAQCETNERLTKRRPRYAWSRGFTLVELVVTLVVISVVATIAVPNFARMVQDHRIVSSSNELVVALQVARTEAVKRGRPTVLCARSAGGGSCSGNDTWDEGWMLFVGAKRVRTWGGPGGDIDLSMAGGNRIGYDALGLATSTQSFTVQPNGCSTGDPTMTINVSVSGTATTTRGTC